MNTIDCVKSLVRSEDIPSDSEVVSTNNKVVVISRREKLVARIGSITEGAARDDPHDLRYSHRVSWLAGDVAPVVQPFHEEPRVRHGYIISRYPLLDNKTNLNDAEGLYSIVRGFGDALAVVRSGMELKRVDIPTYVSGRLDDMQNNPKYDGRLVEYVRGQTDYMNGRYPFSQLVHDDTALIHGDYKVDNIVADDGGRMKAIDLDAAAVGPRLYDLAGWRLRSELGDATPVEAVVDIARKSADWNEDAYRSLIGWKAISSMSFTLRYEAPEIAAGKIPHIAHSAVLLGGLATLPSVTSAVQ